MARAYALRYSLTEKDIDVRVLRWIVEKSPGHLVVKHNADADVPRDHWHALIWTDKKEQALRFDFKKAVPEIVGNKVYSLTEIKKKTDEDPVLAYERYICHGSHEGDIVSVVSSCGLKYTEAWFVEQNELFYETRRTYAGESRRKNVDMVTHLVTVLRQANLKSREEIARRLVNFYKDEGRPLNVFFARSVVNTVWVTLDDSNEAQEELVREIVSKY